MQKASTIPPRASRLVQVAPDVKEEEYDDVEEAYDDDEGVNQMPRSALRFRRTQAQTTPRTTGPIEQPTTRRVSGGTRLLLWVVLVLCVAFLINGLVIPALVNVSNQLHYGDARIATYDINGRHFLTEEQDNRVRIVISSPDTQHNQVLVMPISGVANHALVTLIPDGTKIDVAVNGTSLTALVPDGQGGYKWGMNSWT